MNTVCIVIDNIFKYGHYCVVVAHLTCISHFRFECMPEAFYRLVVHRMRWSGEAAAEVHFIKHFTHLLGFKASPVVRVIYCTNRTGGGSATGIQQGRYSQ